MADIYLTQAEMDLIQAAVDARPADSRDNYSAIYKVISEVLQNHEGAANSSIANWFRGAEQVNAGNGAYSVFIRAYTEHQMQLRGIGSQYSIDAMQEASNEIARRALKDIFNERRKEQDGTWRFPDIDDLALNDATAVGAVLFNTLDPVDGAREGQQNAAWAGAVLFATLGSNQSERLTRNAGDAGLDRLEDLKNILFAYDAARQAAVAVAVEGSGQIGTDFLIGFWTGWNEPGELIELVMQNLSAQLSESARPFGDMIQRFGVSNVLDWIESSIEGKPISSGDSPINGRIDRVFGALGIGDQRNWAVQFLPQDAGSIVELAKSDAAVRNALLGLSPIVVTQPSYSRDTSLYDPESGTGALSDAWLADRAEVMRWDRWYRQSGQTDGVLDEIGGLPFKDDSDVWFLDNSNDYSLKVKGFDFNAPEKRVWFGGDFTDRFGGADGDDRFYGGKGDDQIRGGDGDDYIEGNADSDSLDGGEGQDRLIGGEGRDTLTGGGGSDVLEGGRGSDTYVYASGDGNDTIIDTDGRIVFDGRGLTGGLRKKGESVYRSRDRKHEYSWWGDDLLIDGTIVVKDFKNGNLGIYLDQERDDEPGDEPPPPPPPPPYDPNRSRRLIDPLAFDLNDNGIIDTVGSNASSAYFDFDGDSLAERTGWISGGDGLLAFDANGNGAIDNLSELFGTADVDGFADLKRRIDSNGDNIIDGKDTRFASLLMWRDENGDGIAQSAELSTLAQLGIESINLAATPVNLVSADNRISATSQFRRNGKLGIVGDVEFAVDFAVTDSNPTRPLDQDIEFDDQVYTLPWLRGFGQVKNLNYAYQDDLVLRQAASELAAKGSYNVITDFEQILVRWTGLDGAHAKAGVTRTGINTEDKVWMLETLTGQNVRKTMIERSAFDTTGDVPWDVVYIDERYRDFMLRSATAFAIQAQSDTWLQGAFYSMTQDRFVVVDGERLRAGIRAAVGTLAGQDDADFAAVVLLRLKLDGIDLGEAQLREAFAHSPYALTLSAALDANLRSFAEVDWALAGRYADAPEGSAASFLIGSDGADRLVGASGSDTLFGKAGADTLEGGTGGDLYLFTRGHGQDTVVETDLGWGEPAQDVIRLGAGIHSSEVSFARVGQDLVMRFAGSADQLTIARWGASKQAHIERVEFADGTVWSADVLAEFVRATAALGSAGADHLQAWNGADDLLRGFAGDDALYGGEGDDLLDGGAGNDYISGGGGDDTYLFRRGDGKDTISESGTWGDANDTIRFGPGITAADVILWREGNALVFALAGTDDQLTVGGWESKALRIENVVFDDGATWDAQHLHALVAALPLAGTAGADQLRGWSGVNDTLRGLGGGDRLVGGDGNDVFEGGAGDDAAEDWTGGADTYVFRRGDGRDVIEDSSYNDKAAQIDVIRFGEGIAGSDIVLRREDKALVFVLAGTDDRLTVRRWGEGVNYRIERVQFADGTVWDSAILDARIAQLAAPGSNGGDSPDTIYGWAGIDETLRGIGGNDSLYGDSGDDILEGGTGDDILAGSVGSDTYRFSRGDGKDTIIDSAQGTIGNTLAFGPGISASDIVLKLDGNDILVHIKGTEDQLRIRNQATLSYYGVESITFDDGVIWDKGRLGAEIAAIALVGTDGYDSLFGGDGNNTLIGGAGDDYLAGGAGDDVYHFNRGDGQDTIHDSHDGYSPNRDTIRFGPGITAADIQLSRARGYVIFDIAGGTDRITVNMAGEYGIERIEFDDGTSWDDRELNARIAAIPYVGTDGNDNLMGDGGDNILIGGRGNDHLQGQGGGDVYVFERGSGHDTIAEVGWDAGVDSIRFGAGLAAADLQMRRIGQNVTFAFAGSDDSVTVTFRNSDMDDIERVEFSDGMAWDKAYLMEKIRQLPISGTDGDDTINGDMGENVFDAAGGNDILSGRAGNDVYLFNRGDGQDTILEFDYTEGNIDTIRFGSSIKADDISFYRDRNNYVVLAIAGGYDQITLGSWTTGTANQIERIEFADGDSWDLDYIKRRIDAVPIVGTVRDNTLFGSAGDNVLSGGLGNDLLYGDGGGDTYLFERGDGQDVIVETGLADIDIIRFGAGIAASDVVLSRSGDNMTFAIAGTDDRITVRSWRVSDEHRIERVEFADGTVWDGAVLAAMDTALPLTGTDGNDVIAGDHHANVLHGGRGNDSLRGGLGADTYLFSRGDGRDSISEQGADDVDTIRFGAGIEASDVVLSREGNAMVFAIAGSDERFTVASWSYGEQYRIERVAFADGTVWDGAVLAAKVEAAPIVGTSGSDYLTGDGHDNFFDGGAGNDTLQGGDGNDTYLFEAGDGHDHIAERSDSSVDTIRFGAGIAASDIEMSFQGSALVLAIRGTQDSITISNWDSGDFYRIERVLFADGMIWDSAVLAAMTTALPVLGTPGNDSLWGKDGDNLLDGGAGDDYLSGGSGSDTYVFELGDGQDRISEWGGGDLDTIRFGAGISPDNVLLSRDGNDLVLAIAGAGAGDQITIEDWGNGDYRRIEQVVFDDGTVWDARFLASKLAGMAVLGTDGDDDLSGWGDDELIDGGTGNDRLNGGGGNDTYVFDLGDGQDRITENGYGDIDTIRFGAGIVASDIAFAFEGEALVLRIAGTDDRITIAQWGAGEYYRIEQVVFADGTSWGADDLAAKAALLPILGTEGDDNLRGGDNEDLLDGGAGNDYLEGGAGGDTYVFDAGDGQDRIFEGGYEGVDTIRFGAGIAASDIVLSFENGALVLAIAGTQDRIAIQNWNYGDYYRIEQIFFADGTFWNQEDLAAMVTALPLLGTDGDDDLSGGEEDNLLAGGGGNDDLSGGAGSDTYVFELGDGQDTVFERGSEIDTIRFGTGIAASDIVMSFEGDALVFSVSGTQDRIAITSWGYGEYYRVERVEFMDGTVWDVAALAANLPMPPITGTDGNDDLAGGHGADILEGRTGNDSLRGGEGNDTYVFRRGDGQDVISEGGNDFADTIRFGEGIAESDIVLSFEQDSLVFAIAGTEDRIAVAYWKFGEYYQVERIVFADGIEWDADAIARRIAALPQVGTEGDDQLVGDANDNVLIGGAGDDWLEGKAGNDTYRFELGDGHDTIRDYDYNDGNIDTIHFGAGIEADDIRITRTDSDLVLTIGATGETVTIRLARSEVYSVERVEFADGTVWTRSWMLERLSDLPVGTDQGEPIDGWDGKNETLIGLGGDDYLYAGSGDNILDGGTGDDWLRGSDGSDTYVFRRGDGRDRIMDSSWKLGAIDTIRFGEGITASDLRAGRSGSDLLVTFSSGNDELRIQYWGMYGDTKIERFEFADGTVWDADAIAEWTSIDLLGTDGADQLVGWAGVDDTLRGLGGDDHLSSQDGNDLLEGGTGNDYLSGSRGGDTYVFNRGDGQDTISDLDYMPGVTDTLRFGAGIGTQDLTLRRDGANLVLGLAGSGDSVTIAEWSNGYQNWIERIEFADGSVITSEDLLRRAAAQPLVGTDQDDLLAGDAGDNVLQGGAGNDQLSGGEGSDTYVFNAGDGADFIQEADGRYRGVDSIRFGAHIGSGDIAFTRSGQDLVLSIGADGDAITVAEWGWHASRQVERIEFADGTVWEAADIARRIPPQEVLGTADDEMLLGWAGAADALYGFEGDDTLWADSGDDLVVGGLGNDVLGGQDGSDVYLFNVGDGQDEIYESDAGGGAVDTLRFGDGIDPTAIMFERNGADLYIHIGSGGDRVSVYGWEDDEASRIECIEFANDTVWDAAQIAARIPAFVLAEGDGDGSARRAGRFDKTSQTEPGLTSWALASSLLAFHLLGGSDDAFGGEVAYRYGINGEQAYLGAESENGLLSTADFGERRHIVSRDGIV